MQTVSSVSNVERRHIPHGTRILETTMNRKKWLVMKQTFIRLTALIVLMAVMAGLSTRLQANQTGSCGGQMTTLPFDDVLPVNTFFCAIAEAFFSGLTNGTSSTTYSPSAPVPREQMAAFVTRTMDQSLRRGSRRAALGHWWTPKVSDALKETSIGAGLEFVASDGEHIWVPNLVSSITRVQASTGKIVDSFLPSHTIIPRGILIAAGYVWVVGNCILCGPPYVITRFNPVDGSDVQGTVATEPVTLAFGGQYIWTANNGSGPNTGSITRVPVSMDAGSITTFAAGFNQPIGILYDGANLWITDAGDNSLKRVNTANGTVLQSVPVGLLPGAFAFDGTNLWVPCFSGNVVYVVRAVGGSQGTVLAQLTGNGLSGPHTVAFDGERICVTNYFGDSVSLWKAADLTPLGNFSTGAGTHPTGVCNDGVNFWIVLQNANSIVRF
jgi:hypothetical protein